MTLAAGLFVQASGCTRNFYRKGGRRSFEVLAQKDKFPVWQIENWHIYPDPRALPMTPIRTIRPNRRRPRFPMTLAQPQKVPKSGVARIEGSGYIELMAKWDKENREHRAKQEEEERKNSQEPPLTGPSAQAPLPFLADKPNVLAVPSPDPAGMGGITTGDVIVESKARSGIDITDRPAYLLTLDQAAELAMFNSREFQDQRENLYVSALPVTYGRFSFVAQFFAAQEAARAYTGRDTPQGQTSNWSLNNGTGFSKVLPTGALLLLNFSNQTVFNFLNPKDVFSVTNLNFTAIQPLLQGGGRSRCTRIAHRPAQLALFDSHLRSFPQTALCRNRQPERRQHQWFVVPAVGRAAPAAVSTAAPSRAPAEPGLFAAPATVISGPSPRRFLWEPFRCPPPSRRPRVT